MKKKWLVLIVSIVIVSGSVLGWYFVHAKSHAKPAPSPITKEENPKPTQSGQPTQKAPSGFTPDTFAQLQTIDQETIRDLVQKVRKLGDPQATPEECSLLTLGDAHYAITSFWDPDYYRDPSVWKTQVQDNLWSPELKKDLSKPGAWMIAMLTKSPKSSLPDAVLRWAAPPGNMTPPSVSQTEPIAQACNAGWNKILQQKFSFFSFVKATAIQNTLTLHFTVVKVDKPQNVKVTVPINGSLNAWSLGTISIQEE